MKNFLLLCYLLVCFSANAVANELNVYIWAAYLPDKVVQEFTKETGIKVNISNYDSNEGMYTKIKLLGNVGHYDLVFPSTYFISKMKNEQLLMELDKSKIPNIKNIDVNLLNKPFDPGNKYSIPYFGGSVGIAYNDLYVSEKVDSWNILFSPKYLNKVHMRDDVRDIFFIAFKLLGYSGNDTNEEHIKEAYEKLKTLIPNIRIFDSAAPKLHYINNEVMIGATENGDAYVASLENHHIKYVYPKEGAIFWMDSFAIPANAKNLYNAYKFINFLLKPEIAKSINTELGFATPNKAAMQLLPEKVRTNAVLYPSKEIQEQGEYQLDIGPAITIYEKYFEMLKLGY